MRILWDNAVGKELLLQRDLEVHVRQPEWRVTKGYTINEESGLAETDRDCACTLHFYLAEPGDFLHLLDDRYVYAVATYKPEADPKYLYTYAYQEEENWTQYCHDFCTENLGQEDYVFSERVYFRVILKEAGQCGGSEQIKEDAPALGDILQWQRSVEEPAAEEQEAAGEKHVRNNIEKAVRAVSGKQAEDSINFFLMTDSHYTVNGTWEDTVCNLHQVGNALKSLGVEIDGFLHLGDATDGMVPAEITRDYVNAVLEDIRYLGIPLYYVLGNHDSNYFNNNPERFSREEILELYLQGRKKSYYYEDFPGHCLRIFFLESFDPEERIRYGFSEEELEWLEDMLAQTPSDWYILVCSHVPPCPRLHYWSKEIRGSRRLLRILRKDRKRICFIHGHNHADQVDYEEGFPIISIGCNKCEYFPDKKPEGAVACNRGLGGESQDLWDILTISVSNRSLDFTRFGAGKDRRILWREREENIVEAEGSKIQSRRNDDGGREKPMKKVITYGSFDLFHEGHYNILKRAKELGDYLIVGVTTEHYDEQRGKLNIVDPLLERIENVRKTGLVDEIIIEDHEGQKIEDVQKHDVDLFVLGSDWKGVYDYLRPYCEVVYLERTPDISSTMLRKEKFPIIRMGVVGSGRIAPRFLSEAKYVSGVNVQCVYNPHGRSAELFAEKYFLEGYSSSYEKFLDAVDAVYIATPHETHYDYTRRALLAGKHVLCEKPMALTRHQAEELFSVARERKLVLMEGIKTAFCPGFAQMISIAKSGKIGEIRDVEACFSRLTPPHLREMVDVRYGGAFMEFGSYTVLPILKLLGLEYENVEVRSVLAENGVDLYTKIHFDYANGMATSKTGLGVKSEGQLLISGTKGYILAESPWWLTRKFLVRYEDPSLIETYTPNFLGDGLRYEIGEFTSRINGRIGHAFKLTEEESIAMADVVERFLEKRTGQRAQARQRGRRSGIRIWAHRGASYRYPENTLAAFQAACEVPGLAGVELDIQLSQDGEVVVFHDETLDRLMDKSGNVQDYTLAELQQMHFRNWQYEKQMPESMFRIPSMREVLELLKPYALKQGIRINIELKNSNIPYEGMEEKILALVAEWGMEDFVVYSSFNGESIRYLKDLDSTVHTGILHNDIKECLRLAPETKADDLHPNVGSVSSAEGGMLPEIGNAPGAAVRAWNSEEPFYGQVRQYVLYDLEQLKRSGITDFITNVPEAYLED